MNNFQIDTEIRRAKYQTKLFIEQKAKSSMDYIMMCHRFMLINQEARQLSEAFVKMNEVVKLFCESLNKSISHISEFTRRLDR